MRQISEIVINEKNLVDIIESHRLYLINVTQYWKKGDDAK